MTGNRYTKTDVRRVADSMTSRLHEMGLLSRDYWLNVGNGSASNGINYSLRVGPNITSTQKPDVEAFWERIANNGYPMLPAGLPANLGPDGRTAYTILATALGVLRAMPVKAE